MSSKAVAFLTCVVCASLFLQYMVDQAFGPDAGWIWCFTGAPAMGWFGIRAWRKDHGDA